jgi:hypothetical protein
MHSCLLEFYLNFSLNAEKLYRVMISNSGNLSSTLVESAMFLHLLSWPSKSSL